MKVRVIVTDDDDRVYEGEVSLTSAATALKASPARPAARAPAAKEKKQLSHAPMDFTLPLRALMKQYARGLTGGQKFTLLMAGLVKGKQGAQVAFKDVKKHWGKMTGPLGGDFNPAYSIRAKENGWVDTPKTGYYALRPGWESALGKSHANRKRP